MLSGSYNAGWRVVTATPKPINWTPSIVAAAALATAVLICTPLLLGALAQLRREVALLTEYLQSLSAKNASGCLAMDVPFNMLEVNPMEERIPHATYRIPHHTRDISHTTTFHSPSNPIFHIPQHILC